MQTLLKYFPREVNLYRAKVDNIHDFYNFINKTNSYINCYFSLYDINNNYIDKVAFDLDNENSYNNIIKLSKYCFNKNYKHLMIFSGRGFHFYVCTKNYEDLIDKKRALLNLHLFLLKQCNIKLNEVDRTILGDIKRIFRVPNTLNLKTNLFCIPITITDLKLGIEHIRKKAEEQQFEFKYYGQIEIDIKEFDKEMKDLNDLKSNIKEKFEYDTDFGDYFIRKIDATEDDLSLCMLTLLVKPQLAKNKERFYFAKYCSEKHFTEKSCDELAKKYWSNTLDSSGKKTKYEEFVQEKQIEYAYTKNHTFFPNCNELKKLGLCNIMPITACKQGVYK